MAPAIDSRLTSVLSACSVEVLRERIMQFAAEHEFDFMGAVWAVDHAGSTDFESVRHIPTAYLAQHSDVESGRRDPVMQHCRVSCLPIAWDREIYVRAGRTAMWEEQADHGLRVGIAVATHLPRGRHFFIGLDRRKPLPTGRRLMTVTGDLLLFAAYAQDAASRLLEKADGRTALTVPRLTARELESLRWTSAGKTAWETGRLLSISERTVVKHLTNASRKLGCVRKHQAVARALRLGLIA